ncbi:hypothetical protein GCM10027058_00410 [Microbacterium neimengense]
MTTAQPGWMPAPRAGIVPLHPLTFGTVLGRSFVALRQNPRVLLGFALGMQMATYLVLLVAVGGIAFASFSRLATVPVSSPDYPDLFAGATAITVISSLVLGIASSALTVIVQGVVVAEVAHGVVAEKLTVGALWRRIRPAFWRLFGYTLLASGAVLVAVAIAAAAAFALGVLALAAGIVVAILFVLAAIPLAFWLTTRLFLVTPVLVLEGAGVFAAIARSWRLTRGRFWRTLATWFVIQTGFGIITQIVVVPLNFFSGMFVGVLSPTGDPDVAAVIGTVGVGLVVQMVSLLVQSIALVVNATAACLVYVDARMRTEGLDLDLQSYVDQRQMGAGVADPYRWHIGRTVAPQPAAWPPQPAPWPGGYPAPPGHGYSPPPEYTPPGADAPAPTAASAQTAADRPAGDQPPADTPVATEWAPPQAGPEQR